MSGEIRLKSKNDVVAFIKNITGDDSTAKLLGEILERIGREGYIETRQGGGGDPFHVVYEESAPEQLNGPYKTDRAIRDRINVLKRQMQLGAESEKWTVQKEIAQLAGAIAIIWINVADRSEFERLDRTVKNAFRAVRLKQIER